MLNKTKKLNAKADESLERMAKDNEFNKNELLKTSQKIINKLNEEDRIEKAKNLRKHLIKKEK